MENDGIGMPQAEIRIEGHLDAKWAEWFEGFTLTHTEDGQTILKGVLPDQAALYGLMAKLRDLGVKLISVQSSLPARTATRPDEPGQG